ncbi:MAG: hypothetical protein H6710_17745 [Myxococcales bacterium]|nr:hypothetical protein [Myxococcales bacterium]MCB9701088.1 hypothetical protein [Myxococcales bacterium]
MARKRVSNYAVFHNIGAKSTIIMYYEGGGADSVGDLSIEEASYLVDLLRNESPITYDHALRRFSTQNPEPVGEGES